MMNSEHVSFMRACLSLAMHGQGRVGDGALVGSVLVREGNIIASGWHERWGEKHAERMLLEKFEQKIRSTDVLYVNLEPCRHVGKTSPCTDILLHRGVKRVVCGMEDPDSRNAGEGIALLRRAGVEVIGPVLPQECARLNRGFVSVRTKQRPWITLKKAQMIDGRTADNGAPLAITSTEQNAWSHRMLRARHDAILVGVGTILSDDPQLTIRYTDSPPPLVRIVLDPHVRIPESARVVTDESREMTVIVHCKASDNAAEQKIHRLTAEGVRMVSIDMRDGCFDWQSLWHALTTPEGNYHGITSLLVEGGVKTWKLFAQAGMRDEEVILVGNGRMS